MVPVLKWPEPLRPRETTRTETTSIPRHGYDLHRDDWRRTNGQCLHLIIVSRPFNARTSRVPKLRYIMLLRPAEGFWRSTSKLRAKRKESSHNEYWVLVFPLDLFDVSRSNHLIVYNIALVELPGYRSCLFRATVALYQNPTQAREHQFQLHAL